MLKLLWQSLTKHKDRNAFCINDVLYSYKELTDAVVNIRYAMQMANGSESRMVGIVTTNRLETYASVIACWYEGYAYVPLNPRIPKERNTWILQQARIDIVLSSQDNNEDVYEGREDITEIVTSSITHATLAKLPLTEVEDEHILYLLFTAGSNGSPRAVPITYGNVKSFIDSYNALGFNCTAEDRFLQMFDLTLDVSVASFLIPLLLGASIYTVNTEGLKYMQVYRIMKEHRISFACIASSVIKYLKPYFVEIRLPHLRYCLLTAETMNLSMVNAWAKCLPNANIISLYGFAESTIWCSCYKYDRQKPKSYNELLPIGQGFKNVEAVILKDDLTETAVNEKGELCIASRQLTPGYLNNPKRNEAAFFEKKGKRFYRTGDICYRDYDNDIIYCGRMQQKYPTLSGNQYNR